MRNIISILLLFILVILTPVLFLVSSARFNILTAEFLKQELVKLDVYGLATSQIDERINEVKIDPQYLVTTQELGNLAHAVLTESWLRSNIENTLTRLEIWLQAPPDAVLSLPIDLRQPKIHLTAGIDQLLTDKLPEIKPCPNARQPKEEQGICQFAGLTLAELKEQLKHQGLNPDLVNQLLPDTLDLVNPDLSMIVGPAEGNTPGGVGDKSKEIKKGLDQFKARYQQVVFLINMALVIYVLLVLLFLVINAQRGWRRLTRWGGVLMLMIGVIPMLLALISSQIIEMNILPNIRLDPKTPSEISALVPQVIRDVRGALFNPLLYIGLGFVGLGIGGVTGAEFIKNDKTMKKPPPASPHKV